MNNMKKNYMQPAIAVMTISSNTSLMAGSPQLYRTTETNSTDEQLSRGGNFWDEEE